MATSAFHARIPATDGELEIYEAHDGTIVFLTHPDDRRHRDVSFTPGQLVEIAVALRRILTPKGADA